MSNPRSTTTQPGGPQPGGPQSGGPQPGEPQLCLDQVFAVPACASKVRMPSGPLYGFHFTLKPSKVRSPSSPDHTGSNSHRNHIETLTLIPRPTVVKLGTINGCREMKAAIVIMTTSPTDYLLVYKNMGTDTICPICLKTLKRLLYLLCLQYTTFVMKWT